MSPMCLQMSMPVCVGDSMVMLILRDLITLGEVQHPNGSTLHDRDDPTSNVLNVILPGFDDLPFTLVFLMMGMVGHTMCVLMVILVTVGGSYKSKSS